MRPRDFVTLALAAACLIGFAICTIAAHYMDAGAYLTCAFVISNADQPPTPPEDKP